MKVIALGVGEAWDATLPNTSYLVVGNTKLLLDCGYSVPHAFWKYTKDPNFVDIIYISHAHADHYFGLAPLLGWMWQEKRGKPLMIVCRTGVKQSIMSMMELAYGPLIHDMPFKLDIVEVAAGKMFMFQELHLEFADTVHAVPNLAVRISNSQKCVCYSGDGLTTKESQELFSDCDLLIHEAYTLDEKNPVHTNVVDVLAMAQKNEIRAVALSHIRRDVRATQMEKIQELAQGASIKVLVPEPLDEIEL